MGSYVFVKKSLDGCNWMITSLEANSSEEAAKKLGGKLFDGNKITFDLNEIKKSDVWERFTLDEEMEKSGWTAFQFINHNYPEKEEHIKKPVIVFDPSGKVHKKASGINNFFLLKTAP